MEDFFLDADSVRNSANMLNDTAIHYEVQINVARCLMAINSDKASGNSLIDVGLSDFIFFNKQTFTDEDLESVRELIFKEEYLSGEPSEFIASSRQKEVYLKIICNTINELKKRNFSVKMFHAFGIPFDDTDPELLDVYHHHMKFFNEALLDQDYNAQKVLDSLHEIHDLGGLFLSRMEDSMWVREYLDNTGGYHIPKSWNHHFVPCVTLSIEW